MILIMIILLIQFFKYNIKHSFYKKWLYSKALWRLISRKTILQGARDVLKLNPNPHSSNIIIIILLLITFLAFYYGKRFLLSISTYIKRL